MARRVIEHLIWKFWIMIGSDLIHNFCRSLDHRAATARQRDEPVA